MYVYCIYQSSKHNAISGGLYDFVNNIDFVLDIFKDSVLVLNQSDHFQVIVDCFPEIR